jgi:hypothetical protein
MYNSFLSGRRSMDEFDDSVSVRYLSAPIQKTMTSFFSGWLWPMTLNAPVWIFCFI